MLNKKEFEIHNSRSYNYYLGTKDPELIQLSNTIFEDLAINKRLKVNEKKRLMLNMLCNLVYANKKMQYLGCSLKTYAFNIPARYKPSFYTFDLFKPLLEGLSYLDLVDIQKGYKDFTTNECYKTKFKPTEQLLEILKNIKTHTIYDEDPREYLILRDRESKQQINYEDTSITLQMRNELREMNKLRQKKSFSLKELSEEEIEQYSDFLSMNIESDLSTENEIKLKNPFVKRIFNNDFTLGGRYYGGIESNMPKTLRQKLYIDGEPTVELDYGSMHIRMLYHMKKIDYRADAYDFLSGGDPGLRKIYKILGLCSINSKSDDSTILALRKEIYDNDLSDILHENTNKKLKKLLAKWKKEHKKIKKFFNNDIGVTLQNKDSNISARIIKRFVNKGEVALCIHDSFITKESLKDELFEAMRDEYFKEFKFYPVINPP